MTPAILMAQGNLVYNGGFEDFEKKIKEAGAIEQAIDWMAPSEGKADLFNEYAKAEEFQVPKNQFGEADAMNGSSGYAGLMLYSEKGVEPKDFIQIKLRTELEEEKVYCVKFHVMLAWMSKYACNNLGVYLSEKGLSGDDLSRDSLQPHVVHSQNRIFSEQFEWEPICQTYIASGGEEYITIGNFGSLSETQTEKIKKPKGSTGTQIRGAYYYIDEVSVINMAGLEACDCERDAGGNTIQVVYSKNVSTEMEVDVAGDIEMTRIYFDDLSSDLDERATEDVAKVAALLKEHPNYKVKIVGHTDPVEEAKSTGDVSLNRANKVKTELIAAGVNAKKLLVVGEQDFNPVTEDATTAGQAQNRRVVFSVISKQ